MRIFVVDAFAEVAFAGNSAGVCLLEEPRADAWMQAVAAEMNHPETAFLLDERGTMSLRWFTPTVEVDLCGHATLAAAHVLYELGERASELIFATRSGALIARREDRRIVLDFPARPVVTRPAPPALTEVLGEAIEHYAAFQEIGFAVLADERRVRGLTPDLAALSEQPMRSLVVTARAESAQSYDFVSRYFAPAIGIPEDPVTGSAHCLLGPYWAGVLNKQKMVGYQASRRGGVVGVTLRGDRVELAGSAVTVLRGELA